MNDNNFFEQNQNLEKSDSEKILEQVFTCSKADFIAQVISQVPERQQSRVPFLLNQAMHILNQEQLQQGADLAGGAKEFGDLLWQMFEDYINKK